MLHRGSLLNPEVLGRDPLPRELQLILADLCAELKQAGQGRRTQAQVSCCSLFPHPALRGKKRQKVL